MQHYLNPGRERAHLAIFYKNCFGPQCHVGLGVNGLHTARVLRRAGVRTVLTGVRNAEEIRASLASMPPPSHVLLEAPWVPVKDTAALTHEFPDSHFIVRCHSQIGFLQVEPGAIRLMRELIRLEDGSLNFSLAANSAKVAAFLASGLRRALPLPPQPVRPRPGAPKALRGA